MSSYGKRANEFIKISTKVNNSGHPSRVGPNEDPNDTRWKQAVQSKGKRLTKQPKPHMHDSRAEFLSKSYQGGSPMLTKKIMQYSAPENEQPKSVKMIEKSFRPESIIKSKMFYADGERIHPALLDLINKRNEFLYG